MRSCREASHSGLLYSAEFLEQVRERLAPGRASTCSGRRPQRAVETFAAVFPHTLLLMPVAVLIGSNDPIPFDAERAGRGASTDPATCRRTCAAATRPSATGAALFAAPPLAWTPDDAARRSRR